MRIILLTGGGDWADASAALLVEPKDSNIEVDKAAYPGYCKVKMFLHEWLIKEKGYRDPTNEEAVEIYD